MCVVLNAGELTADLTFNIEIECLRACSKLITEETTLTVFLSREFVNFLPLGTLLNIKF